jgi:hypothetical protein
MEDVLEVNTTGELSTPTNNSSSSGSDTDATIEEVQTTTTRQSPVKTTKDITSSIVESNTRPRPRNRVPHIERRDQKTFQRPYPTAEATTNHPYVHTSTHQAWQNDTKDAKETKKCSHCDKQFGTNLETISRHTWDHYVVYACECGYYSGKCNGLYSHQKREHSNYHRHVRVDKCFFEKAKLEVNANFPSEFPDRVEVKYNVSTPRPKPRPSLPTAPIMTRSPSKVTQVPTTKNKPATITKPPSPKKTRSPVKISLPKTSSPVKPTPTAVTEGPDIDHILTQMTKSLPKPVSPIREPPIPQVTLSNLTPAQPTKRRTVTICEPEPKRPKMMKIPVDELLTE